MREAIYKQKHYIKDYLPPSNTYVSWLSIGNNFFIVYQIKNGYANFHIKILTGYYLYRVYIKPLPKKTQNSLISW